MKSQVYLLFVIIFSTVLSCQSPGSKDFALLQELHSNLVEQRKYMYVVDYTEGFANEVPSFQLFGTGKLVRNGVSSLSRFYFGLEMNEKEHAFFMINNEGHYTEFVRSVLFDEASADVIADSLQSAILLNPDLLMNLSGKPNKMEVCRAKEGMQYEFYNNLMKRLIIVETDHGNSMINKISIHQKAYDNRDYVRSWAFTPLAEEDYKEQMAVYSQQFKNAKRMFL